MKILIIEDEFMMNSALKRLLTRMGYTITGQAMNADDALKVLEEGNTELVILNAKMKGDTNGTQIAQMIREKYHIPFISLIKKQDETGAGPLQNAAPSAYLSKPFESSDIYKSIRTALVSHGKQKNNDGKENIFSRDSLFIREDRLFTKIKFENIRYLKSDGNYIEIHTTKKRHLARATLKRFTASLPDEMFFRSQKSYVINLDYLDNIGSNYVTIDGQPIPLSDRVRTDLMQHPKAGASMSA